MTRIKYKLLIEEWYFRGMINFLVSQSVDDIVRYKKSLRGFQDVSTRIFFVPLTLEFLLFLASTTSNRLVWSTHREFSAERLHISIERAIVFHALHFQYESHECYEMYANCGSFILVAIPPKVDDRCSNNAYVYHIFPFDQWKIFLKLLFFMLSFNWIAKQYNSNISLSKILKFFYSWIDFYRIIYDWKEF